MGKGSGQRPDRKLALAVNIKTVTGTAAMVSPNGRNDLRQFVAVYNKA